MKVFGEFKCPECGSNRFGTSNATDWGKAVGHCHGFDKDDYPCHFSWKRTAENDAKYFHNKDESMNCTPLALINAIRNSFIGSEEVYTQGSCYQLHLILKAVFPQARQWVIDPPLHVLTEIDGRFYDIYGEQPTSDINEDEEEGFFVYCVATGCMKATYPSEDESMVDCKRDIKLNLSTWDINYPHNEN